MKAYVLQPPYSNDLTKADALFAYKLQLLASCNSDADIIVLPEYSDIPCVTTTLEDTLCCHNKYIDALLSKCEETAKRCKANVFVNALSKEESGWRNTTYCYNKEGKLCGKYFKKHLSPLELDVLKLDSGYTYEFSNPYTVEIDGIRYGFLTCYDFYFYEAYTNIARSDVDVIIGCSLQRSDSHNAIEIMCRHLAYNTSAYVVRSSVSFSEDADICGASMIVAPSGDVLANVKGKFGVASAEFDPKEKYRKPAGFGRADARHFEYIETGRKPWQYRPSGSAIIPDEKTFPYPRVCAHRGFNTVAPENSMAAFGAAVAMGAQEIEFDLWPTADGEIVSCHDSTLDRVSSGTGKIYEHTYSQLKELDFGVKFSERFRGLKVVTFEEILKKFSCHVIMNVHVKPLSYTDPYPEDIMKKIVALVRKYECEKHMYFVLETDMQIRQFLEYAPDIEVCVAHLEDRPLEIVDRAIELGAAKVQLFKPHFNKEMIDKAHAHGIKCNMFWSDEPEETKAFLELGIDTILTNEYNLISQEVKDNRQKA